MGENKGGRKKGKMCKEKGVAERRDGYMGETKSVSQKGKISDLRWGEERTVKPMRGNLSKVAECQGERGNERKESDTWKGKEGVVVR